MKRILLVLAAIVAVSANAGAQTLTFEGQSSYNPIANGYGGLNWDNMFALDATNYCGSCGYANGRVSGDFVAYNAYGNPASVLQSASPFTLNSAYFTAAWTENLGLHAVGSVGGVDTYVADYTLSTSGPQFINFGWTNVNEVRFSTSDNSQFALDNLTVNAVTATPEPASLALVASGLVGLGVVRRRRR